MVNFRSKEETVVVLIRHGQTEWSRDDRFTGISDIPLSSAGEEEIKVLCQELKQLFNENYTKIYSSPLRRCVQSADILASKLKLPVNVLDGFGEQNFGEWEGLTRKKILDRFKGEYRIWSIDPINTPPPLGETGMQVINRVRPIWDELIKYHQGENIIIVGHKTTNRLLLCDLLGIPLNKYRSALQQDTACVNLIGAMNPWACSSV